MGSGVAGVLGRKLRLTEQSDVGVKSSGSQEGLISPGLAGNSEKQIVYLAEAGTWVTYSQHSKKM